MFLPRENTDREHSLQKLTQFSQLGNVQDSTVCNTDGIVLKDTHVSSTLLKSAILYKVNVFPLENAESWVLFLSKTYSILIWRQCARYSCYSIEGIVPRDTCVSSIQLKVLFCTK
jgi:hypothetical protein